MAEWKEIGTETFSSVDKMKNDSIFEMDFDEMLDSVDMDNFDFDEVLLDLMEDSSSSEEWTKKSKEKSKRSIRMLESLKLSKIVKKDIRREYAFNLLNIWNSHDLRMIRQFLNHYCVPDLIIRNHNTVTDLIDNIPILRGLPEIIKQTTDEMIKAPDSICEFHNVRIHVRSDNTATITCFAKFSGTIKKKTTTT